MKAMPKHSSSVRANSLKSEAKKSSLSLPPTSKMRKAKTLAPTTIVPLPTPSSSREDNRVATLKKRFAGTILKAQQQLSENRKKVRTEKVREANRNGLEAADDSHVVPPLTPSLKAQRQQNSKKVRIEELREAARKALEEVERSVVVDDSHAWVREYERLCGWPIPYVGGFQNRMHYYGLYLKN